MDSWPEYESRQANRWQAASRPSSSTVTGPKSASASAPGSLSCGMYPSSFSARPFRSASISGRRATYFATYEYDTPRVVFVRSRHQTRLAVCRCFARRVQILHEHRVDRAPPPSPARATPAPAPCTGTPRNPHSSAHQGSAEQGDSQTLIIQDSSPPGHMLTNSALGSRSCEYPWNNAGLSDDP